MTMLATFKNTGRAAAIALALGATAFTAMPAQAAPSSSFSLSLNGGGYGNGITFGNGNGSVQLHFGNDYGYQCYTNSQVEKALGKYGFKQADVVKKLKGDKVLVVARYQGTWYEMRVDKCTGKVDKVKKLKYKNNNFSFTITF
ncbi:MAG: hypothetical protein ABL879_17515 [Devosia sp.]